jgi:hypothetical protein
LKAYVKYVVALVVLLVAGGMWQYYQPQTDETKPKEYTALARAVDECDVITEKAAAKLVAVVEFQKLEIAGRKARVFKICMQDHGYKENPAWTKYAEPIAAQKAQAENSSIDEAFENLKRAAMVLSTSKEDAPVFWVLASNPN